MIKEKLAHLVKGKTAEHLAESYLRQLKIQIIDRNFRSKFGEIDLIGLDKKTLVFFEVRYRSSSRYGSAIESVNTSKQKKIIRTAEFYLSRQTEYRNFTMRFDVIGIDSSHNIDWIKGAFLSTV